MSVRSFTVFQDVPSDLPQSYVDSHVRALTPSATDTAATLLSTLAAIEKENLHPITGQRPGPPVGSEAKKRKTGALATKVPAAPASKKHKELKEKKVEQKKTRKPLGSAGKSRSADSRKSSSKSSRSSRKASPLPPVAEEQESHRRPARLSTSQIDIDSRCYELTVSPLADVSEAYDTSSQEPDVHTERDKSVEPAVCDYIPSMVDKSLQANDTSSNANDPCRQTDDFSTPERKRIYSVFTFSSPSPTSERFKQAQSSPTSRASPASSSE